MQVTHLRVYPIKALDAVPLDTARVLASGALELDRRWAMTDSRGRYLRLGPAPYLSDAQLRDAVECLGAIAREFMPRLQ